MRTNYTNIKHLVIYGIIGCCTTALDFIVFRLLLCWMPHHYIAANAVSCSVGILCSFLLNRKYNFKVTDHAVRRMLVFFSIGLFGLSLSSAILHLCIDVMHMEESAAKLISIVLVAFIQFVLNKYVSFRKGESTEPCDRQKSTLCKGTDKQICESDNNKSTQHNTPTV